MKQNKCKALKIAFLSGIALFFGQLMPHFDLFIFSRAAFYLFLSSALFAGSWIASLFVIIYAMPDSSKE